MFFKMRISRFTRNITTLVFGTAFSQLLPIAISPLLTRLYTPDDFGIYGMLAGIILLLTILATCRFEQILYVTKQRRVRELSVKFVLVNILIFTIITFIIILFSKSYLLHNFRNLTSYHLYLIPFGVAIVSSYISLYAWLNRNGEFGIIRSNLIKQSVALSVFQVVFGLVKATQNIGLLLGDVLGKLVTTLLIFSKFKRVQTTITLKKYAYFWKRFGDIPKIQVPAALLGTFSIYSPMLILPIVFDMQSSGMYFLVFKVVMLPVSLVGSAITDVFKVDAADAIQTRGEYRAEFLRVFKVLALISSVILLSLITLAPVLFPLVFGQSWEDAGDVAQILALLAAFRFLASPLSYSFILRQRFYINLLFQGALLGAVSFSICLGYYLNDFQVFTYSYSILGALVYSSSLFISYKLSKTND